MTKSSDQRIAFEALFRKFHPALVRYAFVHVKVLEDARECVQEVFINVWEKRDRLEYNDVLKYYLYRATKNTCLNFLQKRRLDTVSLDEAITASTVQEKDENHDKARLKSVMEQIDALPEVCREIFLMSRIEGLSHKEIAEILEIAPKTVENQVGIALKKIRQGVKGGE